MDAELKGHLDVLFADAKEREAEILADETISEEYKDFLSHNKELVNAEDYEYVIKEVMEHGNDHFNPVTVFSNSLALALTGKSHVAASYNYVANLWHQLNQID